MFKKKNLVPKVKIRRKIRKFHLDFPSNFSFRAKTKRFEYTRKNSQEKNIGTKTKKSRAYKSENDI
jgi:hypothetical protein